MVVVVVVSQRLGLGHRRHTSDSGGCIAVCVTVCLCAGGDRVAVCMCAGGSGHTACVHASTGVVAVVVIVNDDAGGGGCGIAAVNGGGGGGRAIACVLALGSLPLLSLSMPVVVVVIASQLCWHWGH